jgi:uncharacterized membrane protein YbhN (UPF0104 family)
MPSHLDKAVAAAAAFPLPAWAKRALQAIFMALALFYLARTFRENPAGLWERLGNLAWPWVAGAGVLLVLIQGCNAFILKAALPAYGNGLDFGKSFWISSVANLHSLVLPFQAGMGTRALLLNRWAGLGYGSYVKMSLLLWGLLIAASLWMGSVALLYPFTLRYALPALAATALAAFLFRLSGPRGMALGTLFLGELFLSGLRYFCVFRACGVDAALADCVFMGCFAVIVPIIAPVPGGLGVVESALVWSGGLVHIPAEASLGAALINRILSSLSAVGLGVFGQFRVMGGEPGGT